MIESKYFILFILLCALLFQYFKHKNVQNQTFSTYLSYFHELSLVNQQVPTNLRFVVGFESIKYYIYKNFTISNKEDLKKSFCFSEIKHVEDLQCALFRAQRHSYNMKYFVKNESLFKLMLSDHDNAYSQRLSGSGVSFARQLAYLNNTKVLLVSKIDKSSLKLLSNNIQVASVLDVNKTFGMRKHGVIVYYSENHKAVFNRASIKTLLDDFDFLQVKLMQDFSPHCLVIGQFPLIRNDLIDRVIYRIKGLSNSLSLVPHGIAIHHQFGFLDDVDAGKLLIKDIMPYIDSIDLGLLELHQLHSLVRQGDLNITMYTSDIEANLDVLQDLWTILNSGSFSARTGTRVISRIHLRAPDYHIILVARNSGLFYMNLKYALAKSLMAQLYARCNRKLAILKETVHFYLEDDFFKSHNLTESPIQCWAHLNVYEICVSPVPTCFELKHPLEDAESAAAAALAVQIKVSL